ncbi:MAG: hypothetical protein HY918_04630 [Candidatus Doudnabacteria bacterium]|nr:hypothetical protein [Candidatus Doudnabacteria bacterium]
MSEKNIRCALIRPGAKEACGGEVIPCAGFPEPWQSGHITWFRLYGLTNYQAAKANPDKAICLQCGEVQTLPGAENIPPEWTDTCPI